MLIRLTPTAASARYADVGRASGRFRGGVKVMKEVLGYHVFSTSKGGLWLCDDKKIWSVRFSDAAEFSSADLATDIGERENPKGCMDTIYVFACMGS